MTCKNCKYRTLEYCTKLWIHKREAQLPERRKGVLTCVELVRDDVLYGGTYHGTLFVTADDFGCVHFSPRNE